jgi:hypothetical protein
MTSKLYSTDYVIVDSQTKKPLEGYESIYHYTSVIEILNEKLINEGYEYISMTELPKEEKEQYKQTIKETEEFYNDQQK